MIAQQELTAEAVHELALEVMKRHLKLDVSGYKCDSAMLHNILLKAAADGLSIEAICQELSGLAASNTVRVQLNQVLNVKDLKQHEQGMNEALAEWLPSALYQRWLALAIDTHDEPFYGKSAAFEGYVCRGPAEVGTTHFIRVASVYVIWRDVRLTLAVTYVRTKEAMLRIVKRLLKRVAAVGLRWYSLYMDKAFVRPNSSTTCTPGTPQPLSPIRFGAEKAVFGRCAWDGKATPPTTPSATAPRCAWSCVDAASVTKTVSGSGNGWPMYSLNSGGPLAKSSCCTDGALALNVHIGPCTTPKPSPHRVILPSGFSC